MSNASFILNSIMNKHKFNIKNCLFENKTATVFLEGVKKSEYIPQDKTHCSLKIFYFNPSNINKEGACKIINRYWNMHTLMML